jgi:hypothetical protein
MMDKLMHASKHPYSKFYLEHTDELVNNLQCLANQKQKPYSGV